MVKAGTLMKEILVYSILCLCFPEIFSMEEDSATPKVSSSLKTKGIRNKKKQDDTNRDLVLDQSLQSLDPLRSKVVLDGEIAEEPSEVIWPASIADNVSWQQAAKRAANSWGKSISDYLADAQTFLHNYKMQYRKSKNLADLILLEKATNSRSEIPQFAFKEKRR